MDGQTLLLHSSIWPAFQLSTPPTTPSPVTAFCLVDLCQGLALSCHTSILEVQFSAHSTYALLQLLLLI